jgi:hypothetical protein
MMKMREIHPHPAGEKSAKFATLAKMKMKSYFAMDATEDITCTVLTLLSTAFLEQNGIV